MHKALHRGPVPKRVFGAKRFILKPVGSEHIAQRVKSEHFSPRTDHPNSPPVVTLDQSLLKKSSLSPYDLKLSNKVLESKFKIRVKFEGQLIWQLRRINFRY
jgi:hypothetical protein